MYDEEAVGEGSDEREDMRDDIQREKSERWRE